MKWTSKILPWLILAAIIAGGSVYSGYTMLNPLPVSDLYGVPSTYSRMVQSGEDFPVVKGALNKYRLRPQIFNEHQESSRETLATLTSTTVVGQVWKQSQDNINSLSLTLESAATYASFDALATAGEGKAGTMEYSTSAALQTEYVLSGTNLATRSAYTDTLGTSQDGSYACAMPCDVLGDEWRVVVTSTNMTGVTFSMKYANTKEWARCEIYFFISDGTNSKSYPLTVGTPGVWQTFDFVESSMTVTADDDTATTPTMTAITRMGFRVTNKNAAEIGYVDSITYQAGGGSLDVELWDFGSTLPASNGTVDYTGKTQYTELGDWGIAGGVASSVNIPLIGGKQLHHLHGFVAGTALEIPANDILTVGNYYAIVLKHNGTDVAVYGADTTNSISYYNSGYAWSAATADGLIDIIPGAAGAGAYSDLMFVVFSTQDIWIAEVELKFDNAPNGSSQFQIFIEDAGMKITDIVTAHESKFGDEHIEGMELRPAFMAKGGKCEAYHNDDPTDAVTDATFEMRYLYIPPTVNN